MLVDVGIHKDSNGERAVWAAESARSVRATVSRAVGDHARIENVATDGVRSSPRLSCNG
jgi:hypothetical protein